MSSLIKEDLEKKLFRPDGQHLCEFIETEYSESSKEKHYLCAAVTKSREVQISVVKHSKLGLDDKYEKIKIWLLQDLKLIDGKDPDEDNAYFDMHLDKVYNLEAYSCASKYTFTRCLLSLNDKYYKNDLKIVNFDSTYIDDSNLPSNKGDCMFLVKLCLYAFNLLCLSLCPVS
ncbi:exocyst complex component 1-like [Latimeria chalumnae]|nr:PREDICTED: exocyst complex component 1-like [Latimeria chalumnae]|eukprot:XP_006012955.1 PREDICTED: exocyst complex component 1-like [Latimeria chalumnae]